MTPRNRKRLGLILILLLFAVPVIGAYVLNSVGWRPAGMRNFGTLVEPAQDLKQIPLLLVDGTPFEWKDPPEWHWTLLALPGPGCAEGCLARLDELRRARLTLNQNADRLRVLVVDGTLTAERLAPFEVLQLARDSEGRLGFLRAGQADQVSVALVDPNGFLILRYAEGYDGNGLRRDMTRLVK